MSEDRRQLAWSGGTRFDDFKTSSESLRAIFETVSRAGASLNSVLIQGENGVGKERLARSIHAASERSNEPFVALDCSAIPTDRLELELLGHVQNGLPSDPIPHGLLRAASGGTLYLEEVADLSANAQLTLVRAIETGEARPVGGGDAFPVDLRILSSTTSNLEEELEAGRFRRDLYECLSVVSLRLPPLRERLEDFPRIIEGVLRRHSTHGTKRLSPEAIEFLRSQSWPGNVRELEAAIERSIALANSDVLGPAQIALERPPQTDPTEVHRNVAELLARAARFELPLRSIEDIYIEKVLERTGGNKAQAARLLGVNRTTLYRRGS